MSDTGFPDHAVIVEKIATLTGKFDVLAARFFDHEQLEVVAREERREERKNDREDRQEIIARLKSLEEVQNRNIGRDGVLAALLRSPFVAWLAAAAAAIAAWWRGG